MSKHEYRLEQLLNRVIVLLDLVNEDDFYGLSSPAGDAGRDLKEYVTYLALAEEEDEELAQVDKDIEEKWQKTPQIPPFTVFPPPPWTTTSSTVTPRPIYEEQS